MADNMKKEINKEHEYTIQMEAKRVKGEKSNGEKYNFLAFEGFDKKGNKCTFKFTDKCKIKPEEEGDYIVKVKLKDINKDKLSRYNIYWIRESISVEEYDGNYENDEELPF